MSCCWGQGGAADTPMSGRLARGMPNESGKRLILGYPRLSCPHPWVGPGVNPGRPHTVGLPQCYSECGNPMTPAEGQSSPKDGADQGRTGVAQPPPPCVAGATEARLNHRTKQTLTCRQRLQSILSRARQPLAHTSEWATAVGRPRDTSQNGRTTLPIGQKWPPGWPPRGWGWCRALTGHSPPSHWGLSGGVSDPPPATLSGVARGVVSGPAQRKSWHGGRTAGPRPTVLPTKGWLRPRLSIVVGMLPVGPEQPGQTTTAPVSLPTRANTPRAEAAQPHQ